MTHAQYQAIRSEYNRNDTKRRKRNVTNRLLEYEPAYDRAMKNAEVMHRLGVSQYMARKFMQRFGHRAGSIYAMSHGEFEQTIASAEFEQWYNENIDNIEEEEA